MAQLIAGPKYKPTTIKLKNVSRTARRQINKSYEVYLGLYQAITGPEERQKLFREFSPGFFDLIVIDECHRGVTTHPQRVLDNGSSRIDTGFMG